jgi:hypothetical protein
LEAAFFVSIAEEEHLVSLVLSKAARDFRRSRQFMEPLAHRAWKPPTSSSIAEEEHLVSLHAHCSLRSLRLALVSRCLPHSLAGSLARPGQRRASLAQHGGARFPTLAALSRPARCRS